MILTPSIESYPVGTDFNLSCIVHGLTRYGVEPRWYGEGNSLLEGQSLTWNEQLCEWTSVLAVKNFKEAAQYVCSYDGNESAIDLSGNVKPKYMY